MNNLVLSIITVNFNNNNGLKKTLESVMQQSFTSYEHIIIDACSTDGSIDTIKRYQKENTRLTYWCSEPDKGIYDGMNKGIDQAKGKYLHFLNAGDCFSTDVLKDIPFDGTMLIYGKAKVISTRKTKIYTPPTIPDLIFLCNNSLPHQSCFMHKSLFANQKYDINYKIISDWAHCFFSLIVERCSYQYVPIIISKCDGDGVSSNRVELETERKKWIQDSFPPILSNSFLSCAEIESSSFRSVLPLLSKTRKFKKRMKKLVLFLYKLNSLFSKSN